LRSSTPNVAPLVRASSLAPVSPRFCHSINCRENVVGSYFRHCWCIVLRCVLGTTVGECKLFAMLHAAVMVKADCLVVSRGEQATKAQNRNNTPHQEQS
jgi:hypothetical protein